MKKIKIIISHIYEGATEVIYAFMERFLVGISVKYYVASNVASIGGFTAWFLDD